MRQLNTRAKKATMLTHPTQERLTALGLTGMAKALEEQRRQPDVAALSFEELLALLVDREAIERENKRLTTRLKFACLRQSAVVEDVDMKASRGLDKAPFQKLAVFSLGCSRVNSSRRGPRAWRKPASIQHVTGIWVADVIAAHVTPTSEIPIDGAGFGDQLRKGRRLAGRPVRVKRAREVAPRSRLRHCRYKVGFCRSIAETL